MNMILVITHLFDGEFVPKLNLFQGVGYIYGHMLLADSCLFSLRKSCPISYTHDSLPIENAFAIV